MLPEFSLPLPLTAHCLRERHAPSATRCYRGSSYGGDPRRAVERRCASWQGTKKHMEPAGRIEFELGWLLGSWREPGCAFCWCVHRVMEMCGCSWWSAGRLLCVGASAAGILSAGGIWGEYGRRRVGGARHCDRRAELDEGGVVPGGDCRSGSSEILVW